MGAWYTWEGEQVGSGRMEITSITPTEVRYALHFTAPMDAMIGADFDRGLANLDERLRGVG